MLEMFEGFGELGIFGDALGPVIAEKEKKQVPLRLSPKLYNAIAAWAEDDFRSVNGQIEYLLTECVKQRRKNGGYVSDELDKPFELDFLKDE